LFVVKNEVWEDTIGTEEKVDRREERETNDEKVLVMVDEIAKDTNRSDLVVACWLMKLCIAEEFRWEGH
jgi:hypothetical protein